MTVSLSVSLSLSLSLSRPLSGALPDALSGSFLTLPDSMALSLGPDGRGVLVLATRGRRSRCCAHSGQVTIDHSVGRRRGMYAWLQRVHWLVWQ